MTKLHPYVNFPGTCEEAFNYYKSLFGGDFTYVGRFRDMPPQDGMSVPEEHLDKIMHISLPIGGDTILMGSDSGGDWAPNLTTGNNIALSITAASKADADRFFNGLSAGGQITMPIDMTFWGDYFGMCTDKFGINWMIGFNEQNS